MRDVTMRYPNGNEALRNVDLVVPEGDFVFLVGPSGAGKSTLMRLLIRDELATHGDVIVDGNDLARIRSPPGAQGAAQGRHRVPGLQAPAAQDGVGERRVRARGHRHARAHDPPGRRARARGRRPDRSGEPAAHPAVGRRAAADRDRPGPGPRPADHHRRRADRQPRPGHQLGAHPAPAAHQRAGRHDPDGHPRCRGRDRAAQARRRARGGSDHPRRDAAPPTTARTDA